MLANSFRRGFTLIEVNLAMLIMAGGILSIVGLYAFGFRENRQGREDVAAAAIADAVMSPLVMALSATNVAWSAFNGINHLPNNSGWGAYINRSTGTVTSDPLGQAQSVFSSVMSKTGAGGNGIDTGFPSKVLGSDWSCALVVRHEPNRNLAVVSIGCRVMRKPKDNRWGPLMSMPLFYTEVRFQGQVN